MRDTQIFDSRDSACKQPYGAVSMGTEVQLCLRPERAAGYSRATLTARFEMEDNRTIEVPMYWTGLDGARDRFTGVLPTGKYIGLVWYSFRLESLDGRRLELGEYQLTVYDDREKVPAWFGEGVTYQIFPDRFCRTHVPDPDGMIGGRWVHQNWQENPEYRPDGSGEIRNRDFFGGNLAGVREKLPYLKKLGVDTIYFNPIFEAAENHRYGTGDYEKLDPMFGTNEEFSDFCCAAHDMGMRVILDGVFNHTGYVSRYFNGDGSYPGKGAAQSKNSPYLSWYCFQRWPDKYDSWWGIYSLPAVNEREPSYLDYIILNENSIVRRWLLAGADGWRLDVADELPDFFIHGLHAAAREAKPSAIIIGEVWEDGSSKIAYGERRHHILGGYCDGLMNYPFRNGLIAYLLGGDAARFRESMEALRENYPPFAWNSAMNFLGTHDTPRILTLLGVGSDCGNESREWRAGFRMNDEQRKLGLSRLKLGTLILYAFPGSPTVYYGDEAGMEGFEDPFNRQTFPWGFEDHQLTHWYEELGRARKELLPLRSGDITWLRAESRVMAFQRTYSGQSVVASTNGGTAAEQIRLPWAARDWMTGERFAMNECGECMVTLPPMTGRLLVPDI